MQDVSAVVNLLREGRAALATSLQAFKYIEIYAMIQFSSILLLSPEGCSLSEAQYLWQDIIALIPLSIFMSWTGSASELANQLPVESPMKPPVLISMIGLTLIELFF